MRWMIEDEDILEDEPEDDEEPGVAGGFVLTAGDLDIFKLIYGYRLLRREHISLLTKRPAKRLHRRLLKLVQNRYLTPIKLPQQKHIYALGKPALPVLIEQGIGTEALLKERSRVHELKEFFLRHEMMIVDLHVILALASPASSLQLIAWSEGRELHDSVLISTPRGAEKWPVRPDAFFTLEDGRRATGGNRAHFALEADRSTANQKRFADKIKAYHHYIAQGLHSQKYGIKSLRVVTVTLTEERAVNLAEQAAKILPEWSRKYFLFGSGKKCASVEVVAAGFHNPGQGNATGGYVSVVSGSLNLRLLQHRVVPVHPRLVPVH